MFFDEAINRFINKLADITHLYVLIVILVIFPSVMPRNLNNTMQS